MALYVVMFILFAIVMSYYFSWLKPMDIPDVKLPKKIQINVPQVPDMEGKEGVIPDITGEN